MSVLTEKSRVFFLILCLAFLGVSLGRAYQCIFWDIPIRSLLWNENWMASIVSLLLGLSWEEYLKHSNANSTIQGIVSTLGYILLVCAIIATVRFRRIFTKVALYLSFLVLLFIALLYHLEKFQTAGQFFEYTLQFATPLILWYYLKKGVTKSWILFLKISIALTFISHGLYALGFYPVPANFVAMTIQVLPLSQSTAIYFLLIVGILDLIFSVGLFIDGRLFNISVWYCIVWGFLTTSARVVANIDLSMVSSTFHQWWFESMYRLPHFLIPVLLLLIWKKQKHKLPTVPK